MTLVYVCDSNYRNRRHYPLVGHFETAPSTSVEVTATSDNYCTAAPYDYGAVTIAVGDPINTVTLVHGSSIRSEEFYAGHVLTLFTAAGVRLPGITVLSSFPSTSTKTVLTVDVDVQALIPPPATVFYWLSQTTPTESKTTATVVDAYSVLTAPSAWAYRPDLDVPFALLVYVVGAGPPVGPTPWTQSPLVVFVRDITSFPVHDGEPLPSEQCLVTLAQPIPFATGTVVVVDWMKVNGVTNGNNVGNARAPSRIISQSCANRWPMNTPPGGGPNMYRVQLQHVIMPAQVPVRSHPSSNDTQWQRDSDVLRYGGYVTEFPYVIVQLCVNDRHRPHSVVVPSQAPVAGCFIAVMETFRNNMKPFVVAHCHQPVYVPADEWETVVVTIRLPNGDVVDFDPHPAMVRRPLYAGPDPMSQVQCIFVVDCVGNR